MASESDHCRAYEKASEIRLSVEESDCAIDDLVGEVSREGDLVAPADMRCSELKKAMREGTIVPLNEAEIKWSARIAWRNSSRCIGRLPWRTLHVADCRSITTACEVARCLSKHLESAYNGGAIRPVASIFEGSRRSTEQGRVLNRQLCGYAGYRSRRGGVLGDPINIEFTDLALSLGWVKEVRTEFDLLPWIITTPGEGPRLFDVPPKLIREISLSHPTYPEFAQLGLRWYTVPVISNMSLYSCGNFYSTCLISGWYMGTEVARNLGDEERYNVLPRIAKLLGYDTSHPRTLWKDQAFLDLNKAILHSFRLAGVTITDHHSASSEFVRFCERENISQREVSAKWEWIVPPVSGNLTKVFHRTMRELRQTPCFVHQDFTWRNTIASTCIETS